MADEDRLAVPSHGDSLVQDYIRKRIEPPADVVDGRDIFKVEAVRQPEDDYESDVRKLKTLTKNELRKLLTEVEIKSKEGKGLFSKGCLLNGFAIDRETLESLQSIHHDDVIHRLVDNIIDRLVATGSSEPEDMDTIKKLMKRMIRGYVYLEVPGFKTPIVKLYLGMKERGDLVPKEEVERITNHIKKERKLLPVSSDFRVL